jgi:hypothetical protein
MRFGSLAQILTEVRFALETKFGEDKKQVKVKHTVELDFLQCLCVLIPSDLLFSTNIHYPPLLYLRAWWHKTDPNAYLKQRNSDIEKMADRVLLWFHQLPTERAVVDTDDLRLLLNLKGFFVNLKTKTREVGAALSTDRSGASPGGSCWDALWETIFLLYYYLFLLHFPKAQPIDSVFQLQDRYEGPYGQGGARRFYCLTPCETNRETKGRDPDSSGWSNCCSTCECDSCSRCCGDWCWYCSTPVSVDSPNRGHSTWQHHPYYGSHQHDDPCCRECLVSTGALDLWQDFWQCFCRGLFECCKVCSCAGGGGECNGLSCEGCSECGLVGDDCVSAVISICGAIGALAAFVLDAITSHSNSGGGRGSSDNDPLPANSTNATVASIARQLFGVATEGEEDVDLTLLRRLDSQTSSEYTPSIVFMALALFVFLPRLLPTVVYSLLNLSQGLSVDHSLKTFSAMLLVGLPIGLLLAFLGGASRWTFVTLLLIAMHATYALYSLQRKKVDPQLMDISFLSCAEWRVYRLEEDGPCLGEIAATLVHHQATFRSEKKRIQERPWLLRPLRRILWPAIDKTYLRWALREEVEASHRLDSETLHKRYLKEGDEGAVEVIPVATLVGALEGCAHQI